MKSLRLTVFTFMILTAVAAFASNAQKSFDNLKALAGSAGPATWSVLS